MDDMNKELCDALEVAINFLETPKIWNGKVYWRDEQMPIDQDTQELIKKLRDVLPRQDDIDLDNEPDPVDDHDQYIADNQDTIDAEAYHEGLM